MTIALSEPGLNGLVDPLNGVLVQPPFDWATYPVRAIRTAELLSLLVLRLRSSDESSADEVCGLITDLVCTHPGCAHPLGDRYAASVIPVVLVLQRRHDDHAETLLRRITRWMGDHYGNGLGLAAEDAEPTDEVVRAFGAGLDHVNLRGRKESYLACVLADLAAVLDRGDLYNDIRNDSMAVGAIPYLTLADDSETQYRRYGPGLRRVMPAYGDEWPGGGAPVAEHHSDTTADFELGRRARYWDQLAVQAVLRDRHRISALRAFIR